MLVQERQGVVSRERVARCLAALPIAERRPVDDRARDLGAAVLTVGVDAREYRVRASRSEFDRRGERVFEVRAADAVAAHRHGRLAARQHHGGRFDGVPGRDRLLADRDVALRRLACLAADPRGEDARLVPAILRLRARRVERGEAVGEDVVVDAVEDRIAGLRRLVDLSRLAPFQPFAHGVGHREVVAVEHRECVVVRRLVGDCRPRGDDAEVVADHVGEDERDDPRGRGEACEAAAFQRREVFAHGVDLGDLRAAVEQSLRRSLEVGQGDPVGRRGQECTGPTCDDGEDERPVGGVPEQPDDAAGALDAPFGGDRVVAGEVVDPLALAGVVGDDRAGVDAVTEDAFERRGDPGGGLAPTDDDHAIEVGEIVGGVGDAETAVVDSDRRLEDALGVGGLDPRTETGERRLVSLRRGGRVEAHVHAPGSTGRVIKHRQAYEGPPEKPGNESGRGPVTGSGTGAGRGDRPRLR